MRQRYENLTEEWDEPNQTEVYNGLIQRLRSLEEEFRVENEQCGASLQAQTIKSEIDRLRKYIIKELEQELLSK